MHGGGGMSGRGVGVDGWGCMAGGHTWQGHMWWEGMCGRECAWQGGVWQREACVAGEMATAAGGTHPTGMHSCLK